MANEGVRVGARALLIRMSDCMSKFYARQGIGDPEPLTSKNPPVALSVKIGESVREFELFAIDSYRTVGPLTRCFTFVR